MRLLALSGSLQRESSNLGLLRLAVAFAPAGVEVLLFHGLRDLPHFDPDLETDGAPASVLRWRRALAASDGVLVASPEYGHSLPGVLKNGIDWVIGTGELESKVVAVTASVPHPERGRRGLEALVATLRAVSAFIVGGHPIARGPRYEEDVRALLVELIEAATRKRAKDRLTPRGY